MPTEYPLPLIWRSGPEVIKLFSYSTQLSMKFIPLINVKMPTIVGILTFISMINTTSERLKARNIFICQNFSFYEQLQFRAQLSWTRKKFYNLGTRSYSFKVWCVTRSLLVYIRGATIRQKAYWDILRYIKPVLQFILRYILYLYFSLLLYSIHDCALAIYLPYKNSKNI